MDETRETRRKRILLAEDQAIVALAIEDELGDAGHEVVGPFRTCATAMQWLRGDTPDLAVLDWELSDGPCTEVARELRHRGVKFAIFSGRSVGEAPAEFQDAPWFEKPSDLKGLAAFLQAA